MSGGLHLPGGGDQRPPTDGAALLGTEAEEAMAEAGRRAGILCSACGEGITDDGWEYLSLHTEVRQGSPTVVISKAFICRRDTCATARAGLEQTATARRPWPGWHIFASEDTPPASSNGDGPAAS